MNNFKNFKPGPPLTESDIALAKSHGLVFLFDDKDREWYASQRTFAANTLKIAYDKNDVICSITRDVSALWPLNMSVAEIEDNELSRSIDIYGDWKYIDGKPIHINPDTDPEQLESQREFLREEAIKRITPYMVRLLLKKELPESEKKVIDEWLEYISKLDAIEIKTSGEPEWPVSPVC